MKYIPFLRHLWKKPSEPERLFTAPETWVGGFYNLEIALGERSDERLFTALRAVWNHPALTGCYLSRDLEPHEQAQITPTLDHLEGHLQGIARLPNQKRIACGTYTIRYDRGDDWLGFYVPMGALGQVFPVGGFPFEQKAEQHEVWRRSIENWLVDIGRSVYEVVPFQLALIDFEVDCVDANAIIAEGIPEQRRMGYLLPEDGVLHYYPRNLMV